MEQKIQLQNTHMRLTGLFTLLVFCIASVLQLSFFSYKYFSGISQEVKNINFFAETILKKDIALHELNRIIKNEKKLGEVIPSTSNTIQTPDSEKIMNFAILDSQNNVLLQNIRGEIHIQAVTKVLNEKFTNVYIDNGTIIKYQEIPRVMETYQLLLFKQLDYSFDNYFSDIIRFFITILLSSLIFFSIGYFFVRRNLRPVEINLRDMNEFVHNAGHELKTPISVISSNLQLMKQLGKYDSAMLQENISEIQRLNQLIETLVTLTDIHPIQKKEKISIKDEIEYIMSEFRDEIGEKGIKIQFGDTKDFSIQADREYLYIVLSNILKNAIKFSYEKGIIHISYSQNVCIIQDFGCGIQKQNLSNIFQRFFQEDSARNSEGFGIGLSLVSKIAAIYKWKITLESEVNKGTTFIINF